MPKLQYREMGAIMALSDRIETIPLGEVIRMLARSQKTGCLRVDVGTYSGESTTSPRY